MRGGRRARRLVGGGLRPLVDPGPEGRDLLVRERRPFQGHALDAPVARDGVQEQALVALARDDRRAVVAPLERGGGRVEAEPPFGFAAPWHETQCLARIGLMSRT